MLPPTLSLSASSPTHRPLAPSWDSLDRVTVVCVSAMTSGMPGVGRWVLLAYRFHAKLTVLYVVLGCGAIDALLQLTVL